jgi:hypothetical protein
MEEHLFFDWPYIWTINVFFLDDLSDFRLWILVVIALVFGRGAAMAGIVQQWGYKPFTNDPLGWRKAKKSYEEKEH